MNKPQKCSTKGEGQAELVCLGEGGVVASVHISFDCSLFFITQKWSSFSTVYPQLYICSLPSS